MTTAQKLFYLCLLVTAPLSAQEWSRFRGPNGSGRANAKNLPATWTEKDYLWTATLPGKGASSPVLWGDHLYVTSADAQAGKRYVDCFHAKTGKRLWQKTSPFAKYKKQKTNTFASNTPACDQDHVYVLWQSKKSSPLTAYDHSGKKVWEIDLGPYNHGQGGAVSPMVYQDRVIISNDQKNNSFLLAVDRKTGKTIWKIDRDGKRACYSTPCIFESSDRGPEIIFTHCYEGIIGVDPKTGKKRWHVDPFGRFPQRAIGSPVIYQDTIVASSGFTTKEKNIVAIRPKTTSDGVKVQEIYRLTKSLPHVPSPLIYKDWLFLWSDTGIVSCYDAKTGKQIWLQRAGGRFFGSPVVADGKIYCISYDGDVNVLAASDKFRRLGKVSLGEPSQATPAISEGILYLRTESKLFALGRRE